MSERIRFTYERSDGKSFGPFELPFTHTDLVLELGCGDHPLVRTPNWKTMDYRKTPVADLVFDLESIPWPVESNSYDGVYGSFVIEHIAWRHTHEFISECFRLLKPGGHIVMIGPNTLQQCKEIAKANRITEVETAMIFGGGDDGGWNSHKAAFSPDSIIQAFAKAGFKECVVIPWVGANTDMQITAEKPQSIVGPENINFGSFTVMTKGWLNCDILDMTAYANQNNFSFKQVDCAGPLPFESGTVKNIISSHMLEHLTRAEGLAFLKECHRILANEGVVRITVPDTKKIAKVYVDPDFPNLKKTFFENEGVKNAADEAEAFWNFITTGHKTAYDSDSLTGQLMRAGFIAAEYQPGKSFSKVIETQTKDMFSDHSIYVEGIKRIESVTQSGKMDLVDHAHPQIKAEEAVGTHKSLLVDTVKIKESLNIGMISTQFFGCPPAGYSGLEMIVWDLAEALGELGHHVTLFAPEGSKAPLNGKLVTTGKMQNTAAGDWYAMEEGAYNIYKDQVTELDIIHGHNWFGQEYNFAGKIKVCHTHHGHLNQEYWMKSKPPFKLNFIAISKWMKGLYEKMGMPSEYCYNGIDTAKYPIRPIDEVSGAVLGNDRLLYVGRISKFKQPHVAIELARRLDYGLDIVGGTFVDDQNYLNEIRNACDGKQITFNPDVSHAVKIKFMREAKCLVFPSAMGEPFGLVAAEAMACGTPVLALNDGAISEVVEHNVSGFIAYKNFDAFKTKTDLISALGGIGPEACRSRAEMFSRKTMAENYVKLYTRILKGDEW